MTKRTPENSGQAYAESLRTMRQMSKMRFVALPFGHLMPRVASDQLPAEQLEVKSADELSRMEQAVLKVGTWLIAHADHIPVPANVRQNTAECEPESWCQRVANSVVREELYDQRAREEFGEAYKTVMMDLDTWGPPHIMRPDVDK